MSANYYNILWGRWELSKDSEHPAHKLLRKQARSEGWVGVAGYEDFVKEKYNGRLYKGKDGNVTGIGFRNEEDRTLFALSIEND
jgi:hypothetical protein